MSMEMKQNPIFLSYELLIPYLPILIGEDCGYGITDTEKFLKYIPHKNVPVNIKTGDFIVKGSAVDEAIKMGKPVERILPKNAFGEDIKVIAIPIMDNNAIVGCISIGKNLSKQKEIAELSKVLSSSLDQIYNAITKISSGISNVTKVNGNILERAKLANDESENIDEVLNFVKNVGHQTNLLGLNAAIEASRAGEAGKGFNVVAQEIRKLSNSSGESVNKINGILKSIQQSIFSISKELEQSGAIFQDQVKAIQEINNSMEQLNETAQALANMANKI